MKTEVFDDLIQETHTATELVLAITEGLENYARLDLRPGTLKEVQSLLDDYRRRLNILHTTVRALSDTKGIVETLLTDGDPALPVTNVEHVKEYIEKNIRRFGLLVRRLEERTLRDQDS